MKLLPTIGLLFLTATAAFAQQVGGGLRIGEKLHDFGTIREKGGSVSHTFTYTNTGKNPALIVQGVSGCSCVQIELDKKPVQPGKQGHFTVRFDPAYRPGFFSKEINLRTAPGNAHLRVWVKGTVEAAAHPLTEECPYAFGLGLYSDRQNLLMGSIRQGTQKSIRMRCANNTDKPMRIAFDVSGDDTGAVTLPEVTVAPHEIGSIAITYTMPRQALGVSRIAILPIINGSRGSNRWTLSAIGIPPTPVAEQNPAWRFDSRTFTGRTTAPRKIDYRTQLHNTGQAPLRILSVDTTPGSSCSLRAGTEVAAGKSLPIVCSFEPQAHTSGTRTSEITLVTNDPYHPVATLTLRTTID